CNGQFLTRATVHLQSCLPRLYNSRFRLTRSNMLKLAAFADEISPNLDEQIRVCKQNGITHIELRSVGGKNVLDFDKTLRNEIKTKLDANGLGVVAIGSPIGKVKIDEPWEIHFNRFKIAV